MNKPETIERPLIYLNKLSRTFTEGEREHVVFRDVQLRVQPGEIIVLLGRSGSGKSTLLNLVSGIDLPDAGDVIVDSINITRLSEHKRTLFRRKHIGFIFQFFNLIPTLTVAENLLLPLELNNFAGLEAQQRVKALLAEVALSARHDSYPDLLSGGEQQRVAVARALIHGPGIILADEPTGNLDKETGIQVLELLDRMVRDAGKTMLMATHSPEVIGLADRIVTFEGENLVEVTGKVVS
jgi:putative ABC transport system ATP-binding protein